MSNNKVKNFQLPQGNYNGEIDTNNNKPHGFGVIKFNDGGFYKGNWVNGKWEGKGRLVYSNGSAYEGDWVKGYKHGKGTYTNHAGDSYKGAFRNGRKHGYGIYTYACMDRYEGDFYKDSKHGNGMYYFINGDTFEGQFLDNKAHGNGVYKYRNGRRYVGQWENDERHGIGKLYLRDGQTFDVEYVQGKITKNTEANLERALNPTNDDEDEVEPSVSIVDQLAEQKRQRVSRGASVSYTRPLSKQKHYSEVKQVSHKRASSKNVDSKTAKLDALAQKMDKLFQTSPSPSPSSIPSNNKNEKYRASLSSSDKLMAISDRLNAAETSSMHDQEKVKIYNTADMKNREKKISSKMDWLLSQDNNQLSQQKKTTATNASSLNVKNNMDRLAAMERTRASSYSQPPSSSYNQPPSSSISSTAANKKGLPKKQNNNKSANRDVLRKRQEDEDSYNNLETSEEDEDEESVSSVSSSSSKSQKQSKKKKVKKKKKMLASAGTGTAYKSLTPGPSPQVSMKKPTHRKSSSGTQKRVRRSSTGFTSEPSKFSASLLRADTLSDFDSNKKRIGNGMSVDDYVSLGILGQGAFGEVRLVRSLVTNEIFAMKVVKKSPVIQKKQTHHIMGERNALARIQTDWVVNLYYAFQDGTNLYMIMEYACGGDLQHILEKKTKLSEDIVRLYFAEIAAAIHAVHKCGYVHRDIKPDNILLDKDGHVKLSDFGLCKELEQEETYKPSSDGRRSSIVDTSEDGATVVTPDKRLFSTVGTPDYIAPEVFGKGGYGKPADWWSLGVMIYEALVGYPPFVARDTHQAYLKIKRFKKHLKIPSHISNEAKEVIENLIASENDRADFDVLKKLAFFDSIEWNNIRSTQMPFAPKIKNEIDMSYFPGHQTNPQPIDVNPLARDHSKAFFHFDFKRR